MVKTLKILWGKYRGMLLILFSACLVFFGIYFRIKGLNFESGDYLVFLTNWYDFLKLHGFSAFKYEFSDYTPSYLYLLYFTTILPIKKILAIKAISFIFDIVACIFVYFIVKKRNNDSPISLLAAAITFSLPSLILNSTYWGQCDIIFTAFCLGSIYFLIDNKINLSIIFYALALSFKLQAIFLLPIFFLIFFRKQIKFWHFLLIPLVYFLTILPSNFAGRSLSDLFFIYSKQAENYDYIRFGIPNIYVLINNNYNSLYNFGIFMAIILTFTSLLIFYSRKHEKLSKEQVISYSLFFALLMPMILPKMHERYFFLAEIISVIYAFYKPKWFIIPVVLVLASFMAHYNYIFGRYLLSEVMLSKIVTIGIILLFIDCLYISLLDWAKTEKEQKVEIIQRT